MYIYLTISEESSITSYDATGAVISSEPVDTNDYPDLVAFMLATENNGDASSSSVQVSEHDGTILKLYVEDGRNFDAPDMAIYAEVSGDVLEDINAIYNLL